MRLHVRSEVKIFQSNINWIVPELEREGGDKIQSGGETQRLNPASYSVGLMRLEHPVDVYLRSIRKFHYNLERVHEAFPQASTWWNDHLLTWNKLINKSIVDMSQVPFTAVVPSEFPISVHKASNFWVSEVFYNADLRQRQQGCPTTTAN